MRRLILAAVLMIGVFFVCFADIGLLIAAETGRPILIGLDADMSSGSAKSGEAIRRGLVLAIDEINGQGGVLGRPLQLVVRDHRGNPARGIDNIEEFAGMNDLAAVVGGLHTPVAMAELQTIHEHKIIYLGPWAAGTPVIKNGYSPNYAFRVSVRDEYAGGFLIKEALVRGYKRPGLLLEQTGWGRSNDKSMNAALKKEGITSAGLQWFLWGVRDLKKQISALRDGGADVIMLVANAPEGIAVVKTMASLPEGERLPILSHWGITGGDFFQKTGDDLAKIDLLFLQTYSFLAPTFPNRATEIIVSYKQKFPKIQSAEDIIAPAGTAHAYDLLHLLTMAIKQAGVIERPKVRNALEQLQEYHGLIKNYQPPFTSTNHDALTAADFRLAKYNDQGDIVPVDTGN